MYRQPLKIAALTALALTVSLKAQEVAPKVVLVELFTSEGCSSCPSADALLGRVNGVRTNAGQLLVGISEHVTYWDGEGWTDPFSSRDYTERQNAYAENFRLDGVYTPQMVINGAVQIVGSDGAALVKAVQEEEGQHPRVSLHIQSSKLVGNSWTVDFSVEGDVPAHGVDLIAVVADDSDRSSVLHGENHGKTLAHVSVARSISRVAKVRAPGEQTVQVKIPSSFQAAQGHHLILLAQTPGTGRILGADTKPL